MNNPDDKRRPDRLHTAARIGVEPAKLPMPRGLWRQWRLALPFALGGMGAGLGGCGGHDVPEHPTWADVEPIVRGACTQCHGSTAAVNGASNALTIRLDFYDMTPDQCGEAATVLAGQTLARGWASLIKSAVTPPGSGWRARMPPAPAPELLDWQREALVRWASEPIPERGEPSRENHRPDIQLEATSAQVDTKLPFSAVVSDADAEPVVGVLKIGPTTLQMDRAGAFAATLDTTSWPAGIHPISAILCDGWDSVEYDLGAVDVRHVKVPK